MAEPGSGDLTQPEIVRLVRRAEFLAAARGRKCVMPAFVLQMQVRPGGNAECETGLGLTASRRVGRAVQRNRARRRLREAARQVMPTMARPGFNYVLVARPATLTWPFDRILEDLRVAFARLGAAPARRSA